MLRALLHGWTALSGLGAVLVVLRLLRTDRLPADRVPHGVHLADDVSCRTEVRTRLLFDRLEGPSLVVFNAQCCLHRRQYLRSGRRVTG